MATAVLGPSSDAAQNALTYTTAAPTILAPADQPVAIRVEPEKTLYRVGALPRVVIESERTPGGSTSVQVRDGFGSVLVERIAAAGERMEIRLPEGHGYYEVIAELRDASRTLGTVRRSIGALTPPPEPRGDEPFGLWIQGEDHYPELGVRWLRDGVYWTAYRAYGDKYLAERRKRYEQYRAQGIRVIAFPKTHPHQVSREVIADTPEAWRDLEEWWTKIVRTLAGSVDAWGVVNEPMRGHWKGSEELIVRYWALMRRIVDRHDPKTPLIGPSLSPNMPSGVRQYRDLLGLGFGRLIDAVEMHTYISSPEDKDWAGNTRRIRDMTREAVGRDLPIWSTEHGSSATYQNELQQAQHLMRSWFEAKRIGYPVVIWHMFSHPQGGDARERQFALFRNVKRKDQGLPQPRPAGVAYGVMTRELAGARFVTRAEHFGPAVNAYVFERRGKAMMALWTTGKQTHDVALSVGEEKAVTATGLFGRVTPLPVTDAQVRLTVDRNPVIVAPLPRFYLDAEPIAKLDKPVQVLPGGTAEATITLVNPTNRPTRVALDWQPADGWSFRTPQKEIALAPRERKTLPVTARAAPGMKVGRTQVYAKVLRDGTYVASMPVQAAVLPEAEIVSVAPTIKDGASALAGIVRRNDPKLQTATVRLDGNHAEARVRFARGDEAAFMLPVDEVARDRLGDYSVAVYGRGATPQASEHVRASFAAAAYATTPPKIDGDLGDWPKAADGAGLSPQWRWDEKHLYLALRVPDAKHVQSQAPTELWKEDSLQFALAPGDPRQLVRAPLPGLQESDMMEFDVALKGKEVPLYRHRTLNQHAGPAGPVAPSQIRRAVRHAGGATTYELQIPIEALGLKPLAAGQILRASLLLNASDGRGRETREWFGGIKEAKDPNLFGHLILTR